MLNSEPWRGHFLLPFKLDITLISSTLDQLSTVFKMNDQEKGRGSSPEEYQYPERKDYSPSQRDVPIVEDAQPLGRGMHDLHRGLKARQVTMIAIGGAIGTGLIIGT